MNDTNIFRYFDQIENSFTNGFISLLKLSRFENPELVGAFLRDELGLALDGEIQTFRVLPREDGTADAELSGNECCIWFETKITSGTLCKGQIQQHLEGNDLWTGLKRRNETFRRLVLLTPDDSASNYIKQFLSIDGTCIRHLGWKRVSTFLEPFVSQSTPSTFSELVRQFRARIHDMIFMQDMAGVILKINFGDKSEVYADKYLDEMKAGSWTKWNTPRECKSLDGRGRKLILYDSTRKEITVEVEIKSVKKTESDVDYPWTNEFADGKPCVFERPIPLSEIQLIKGFENFGRSRGAFRNITHEQYRALMLLAKPIVTPEPRSGQVSANEKSKGGCDAGLNGA